MKLQKEKIPFTLVANEVLKNPELSWKAKGLYAYLFSKPDEWDFSGDRITIESRDGRKVIFAALKELEDQGFLQRERLSNGKMEYTLKYSDKSLMPKKDIGLEKPTAPFGSLPKRPVAEKGSISNIEGASNIEEESNTYSDGTSQDEIVSIIEAFKEVNQAYKKWFGNTTQRSAISRLVKNQTIGRVLSVIKILPKTNLMPYIPTITTPVQLEDKWSQLESTLKKKKEEITNKKPKIAFI